MSQKSKGQIYRGRFAPSPSGPLHFGSLVAALGSYLQARSQTGEWLLRMEDLDPPRETSGADTLILKSLNAHGLNWDNEVMYQSRRHPAYEQALEHLKQKGLLFYCSCTRKQLRARQNATKDATSIYAGTCREHTKPRDNCAIRIRVPDDENAMISFRDHIHGSITQNLKHEVGDFVLKRRDGLYAYQLAVVVDDIAQGITEVVRGADLLNSTPRQLYLYQCLNAPPPSYLHLPLALLPDRKKLSKQTGAPPLDNHKASANLVQAMRFLGMPVKVDMLDSPIEDIIKWGITNWNESKIPAQDIII